MLLTPALFKGKLYFNPLFLLYPTSNSLANPICSMVKKYLNLISSHHSYCYPALPSHSHLSDDLLPSYCSLSSALLRLFWTQKPDITACHFSAQNFPSHPFHRGEIPKSLIYSWGLDGKAAVIFLIASLSLDPSTLSSLFDGLQTSQPCPTIRTGAVPLDCCSSSV